MLKLGGYEEEGMATTTLEETLFAPVPVPEDLRKAFEKREWPEELLERALELRVSRERIEGALARGTPPFFKRFLEGRQRLMFGTLRARHATPPDAEALSECHAHSPEDCGEWDVTVERSPRPFAQCHLMENPSVSVVEDRGVILATNTFTRRNTMVGGKLIPIVYPMSLRVRKECRGQGLSDLVRGIQFPGDLLQPPGISGSYFIIRGENLASFSFFRHTNLERAGREGVMAGTPVTVLVYPSRPFEGDARSIRKAKRSEIRRCVALINRTHRGLGLFRPYTPEYLRGRLDEGMPGPKPPAWLAAHSVYGWQDYYVLEEAGQIVACAGLWDRGRDMREVWRHKTTGEEHTRTSTDVLDFGYAAGSEDAMARLIAYLIGETARLERDHLQIPLEQLPSVAARLEEYDPVSDTRGLQWYAGDGQGPVDLPLTRIYIDLSYW